MKHHITDALQVISAIIVTTSMVVVNAAPLTPSKASINREVTANSKPVTPVKTNTPPVSTPVAAVTAKETTWQDNPNHCDQDKQYIASTAPFACIDKQTTVPTSASVPAASPAATTAQVTGNYAKDYIYSHESGNNPNATNSLGCYGIGQDCNGVVRSQCGADWACQDEYFSGYAVRRYGSWEAAYSFWVNNHWW